MALVDRLILPADVSLTPVRNLSASLRARLGAKAGDTAVTRLRGRAPAKLVDRQGAMLLREFAEARYVADAVRAAAARLKVDPVALLNEAFPLLRDCYNSQFLVPADSSEASRTLPSRDRGDRVGRYRVLRCLRVVGDTELYQVRDPEGSMAALKLARPGVTSRATFRREIAALERITGQGAPRLLRTGTHARRAWLAMEWCAGVTPDVVTAELRRTGDLDRLRRLLVRIARVYAALHRLGVLHGDIHPGNILVARQDRVTLIDFGLAAAIPPTRLAGRARRGIVPHYAAPEQASAILEGRPLPHPTPASEQYAVAVLLYQLATGAYPVDFSLDRDTMFRQIVDDPPLPFSRRGTRPWPTLEPVLRRALSKAPSARFRSVNALARALAGAAAPIGRGRRGRSMLPRSTELDARVNQFLERTRVDRPALARHGRPPRCSLMLGRAGTAYALYRLACLRDEGALLACADAWLRRTERATGGRFAFVSPRDGLDAEGLGPVSPFHAITGVRAVRTLISLAMDDRSAARDAITEYCRVGEQPWPRRDLTLGRMGVVLGCALQLEALPQEMTAERAALTETGRRTLSSLWEELDELGRIGAPGAGLDHGIAHGWGGMIWATLRWREATGDPLPRSLDSRLDELADGAEPLGRGMHWAQHSTGSAPSVLATHQVAGWCNGPSGMVHLLTLAQVHFPHGGFGPLAEASAWSAWEAPSGVFDLCCGLVGRAYALLARYRHTGEDEWLQRAGMLATRAFATFDEVGAQLPRPLSLFKGEAGLAVLAADLRHPEQAALPFFESEGFPSGT